MPNDSLEKLPENVYFFHVLCSGFFFFSCFYSQLRFMEPMRSEKKNEYSLFLGMMREAYERFYVHNKTKDAHLEKAAKVWYFA